MIVLSWNKNKNNNNKLHQALLLMVCMIILLSHPPLLLFSPPRSLTHSTTVTYGLSPNPPVLRVLIPICYVVLSHISLHQIWVSQKRFPNFPFPSLDFSLQYFLGEACHHSFSLCGQSKATSSYLHVYEWPLKLFWSEPFHFIEPLYPKNYCSVHF